ncbi:MAG: hypothetical protein ACR2K4_02455 [Candidatus Limnocylindria bacterium]
MRVYTHTDMPQVNRSLQVRVRIDPERVEQFKRLYLAGAALPPITLELKQLAQQAS